MALKNKIDPERAAKDLADWLGTKYSEAENIRVTDVLVPGAAGLSNETVLFTASWQEKGVEHTQGMVARVQPDGPGVFPTYDLGKEVAVLTKLAEHTPVPVPGILFYEKDSAVFGSPFVVMERIDGRVPADDPPYTQAGWVLDLQAEERSKLWKSSMEALVAIHEVDWRNLGLDFLDTRAQASGLDAQLAKWEKLGEWALEGQPNPTISSALAWLRANQPADGDKVLIWGDARIGNIIFADDHTAAAVIDWETVALSCREQDVGWWQFMMLNHTDGIGQPLPSGVPNTEQTAALYEELSGVKLQNLDYYTVLAGTCIAMLMARVANMMIAADMLEADSPMAVNNPVTQLVAKLLDLPAPEGAAINYVGNR